MACEFCKSAINEKTLLGEYNNRGKLEKKDGFPIGVNVISELNMYGNTLEIHGYGYRITKQDVYYLNEGLDEDFGDSSPVSNPCVIQIKYCPFCGEEIKSKVAEVFNAKQRIRRINKEINVLQTAIENINCVIVFAHSTKYTVKNKSESIELNKLRGAHIYCLRYYPHNNFKISGKYSDDMMVRFTFKYDGGSDWQSSVVSITDEQLIDLAKNGKLWSTDGDRISYTNEKISCDDVQKILKERDEFKEKITKLEAESVELKKFIDENKIKHERL